MSPIVHSATFAAALGSGVLGGTFFSWSNLVMPSLARIRAPAGIAAMNAANEVVYNPLFFLVFMGVPLLSIALAVHAVIKMRRPGSLAIIVGAISIIGGMFFVTALGNVPLNETLARLDPTSAAAVDYWQVVKERWPFWNHVRTLASMVAMAAFIWALTARARSQFA